MPPRQRVEEVIAPPPCGTGESSCATAFIDSSLAYQGVGRGLGIEAVMDINRFAMGDMMPDKTFFLDFPPHLAFERMSKKRVHDRLETQGRRVLYHALQRFCEVLGDVPDRIVRIDASGETNTRRRILCAKKWKKSSGKTALQ